MNQFECCFEIKKCISCVLKETDESDDIHGAVPFASCEKFKTLCKSSVY
jgi:hypothetical protein